MINSQIKNTWHEFQILKKTREEKMQSLKREEENNFAIKEMYKILEEANLNSCDEIVELQLKEARLSSNFDIISSLQSSLENLNSFKNESPSVSTLIAQSIKQLRKAEEYDSKICLLYTSPSPRDLSTSRMPSSA